MDDNNQNGSGPGQRTAFEQRFLLFAAKIYTIKSLDALLDLLRDNLLRVFEVEMASIFLVDSLKMQLVSWVVLPGKSLRKIRIPINKVSIAGYTASARELVLIQDPYDGDELQRIDPDLQFDYSWDKQAGIRTRQILATPILEKSTLLGVIQLMNKCDDNTFEKEDKRLIRELANTIGSTLLRLQSS